MIKLTKIETGIADGTVKKALWGSPDKMLKIGDVDVECYVLEGGTRVLSGRGMQAAIGFGGEASAHGSKLRSFLEHEKINQFVVNDLAMAINKRNHRKSGPRISGPRKSGPLKSGPRRSTPPEGCQEGCGGGVGAG